MSKRYYASRRAQQLRAKVIVSIILFSGSIILIMPLWWMISTSLKSMEEIMQYPPTFYPHKVYWRNYVEAWNAAPFTRYTFNTLIICFFSVVGSVLSNSFVGYGFAKIRFRGRETLMNVVLSTMIIPGFVTLIPTYVLFSKLGWVNTYLPLTVPSFFGSTFFIFMFRQFYMTIPNELVEAAMIDGANHFYIWFKLMLPLVKPVLATVAIFSFNGAWNDLLGPLLYINDEMKYTLQIGLQNFRGLVQTQWHYLMAASTLVLLPVLILFFAFQRYFIEGMNLTAGTKG
ncbi:multiple sugar transport system permease protein [Caldicoprobacter guelmensis]|uniref:carbohydrate ABC transporter permease n=1 Tax=Caldicoprobacter guelmensis TaxID=1170224 RepID=UPI00195CB27C|nr:carbohydrate ABC transporter permease [Caldicoprobacter guelmensis]MBM7582946.1 multiple sugar transport system permease protein [Caldicoprobacter guelmensis]